MQKLLIITGLVLFLAGIFYPLLRRLPIWRLPGDIFIKTDGGSFFFPIVTCIVVSITLTLIINFFK